MGCKWCTSGLGRKCEGPLGLDDLECGCQCQCHVCPDCFSAYCVNVGGPDPCEDGDEGFDYAYDDDTEVAP
jgi:hypothetical protein